IRRLLEETRDARLDRPETLPDAQTALLGLRILDPACGSGHFLIAAAHRIAGRLVNVRTNGNEPTPTQLRTALREVIGRCVYGIDINPMAVELCKVSLWLEANHNGQPLSFLDHHIVCGNSLLGTTPELLADGVPQAAFKKRGTDDSKHLANLRRTNLAERKQRDQGILALEWSPSEYVASLADDFAVINAGEDNTTADIDAKADLYEELQQSQTYLRAKAAADAWCAAFVIPKTPQNPAITDSTIRTVGQGYDIPAETREAITMLSEEYQFLHPHLVFPDVFERSDGFDLVIGNPPWGRVKLQEKKWFATRDTDIAQAPNQAARRKLINILKEENPALHTAFQAALRQSDGISTLLRNSGYYPLTGRGDINTYAVFAEFMRNTTSPTGRTGMIVPTGIATDDTTKHFLSDLVDDRSIVSLYDFENRKRLFPAVDSRQKFCLLSLSGKQQPMHQSDFVFFAHDITDINDPDRHYTLSPADFALFNPNTRNCPIFRSDRDMAIARKMYHQSGELWKEPRGPAPEQNHWGISFQRMFDMSNDSGLFRTRSELDNEGWTLSGSHFIRGDARYLPLYESKLYHQYDHRIATFEGVSPKRIRDGIPQYVTPEEKTNPHTVVIPRYWVPEEEVVERLDVSQSVSQSVRQTDRQTDRPPSDYPMGHQAPRRPGPQLAFRKITNATNERTGVFTMIPSGGLSDSGTTIIFGSSYSERSLEQQTSAHSSLQPSEELP
ncbi:MAG: Eco57I restriction-modification methylase domain-containing protein, partial [Actinomycetia bacterium]|nr:Eco57I restriction-modification methylase domain-containing protein [Actinomycetes bacterium]